MYEFRGQWGGKIDSGEEMWWSEPNPTLMTSTYQKFRFYFDVRHYFILNFWNRIQNLLPAQPFLADFGCGTAGTTLNFSRWIGKPIHGIDLFETQLKIAEKFSEKFQVSSRFYKIHDGKIPLESGTIDVLFSFDVLGHVPQIPETLKEWARVVKSDGHVLLFTEADYSPDDHSIGAKLAKAGINLAHAVPEHISLFPSEELERFFSEAGFTIEERVSANVGHFFFFPKDYLQILKQHDPKNRFWFLKILALVLNRLHKWTPLYPRPQEILRLMLTKLWGREAYGTGYFYRLKRKA